MLHQTISCIFVPLCPVVAATDIAAAAATAAAVTYSAAVLQMLMLHPCAI